MHEGRAHTPPDIVQIESHKLARCSGNTGNVSDTKAHKYFIVHIFLLNSKLILQGYVDFLPR